MKLGQIRGVRDGKVILAPGQPSTFAHDPHHSNPKNGQMLAVGDEIPGTEYEIIRISPKMQRNESLGIEEDVSEIGIRHLRTKQEHTVVPGKVTTSEDKHAILEVNDERKRVQVAIGGTFEFPVRSRTRYEVKEITGTHLVLVNIATKERTDLRRSADAAVRAE